MSDAAQKAKHNPFHYSQDQLHTRLKAWGWPNGVADPNIEMEVCIHQAFQDKRLRIGEMAIELGIMTDAEVEEVLEQQRVLKEDQAAGKTTFMKKQHFVAIAADKFPSVSQASNRLNAIFHEIPYYRNLDGVFEVHPILTGDGEDLAKTATARDKELIEGRLTDIMAALMIHDEQPLLIFQSHDALHSWRTQSKAERSSDPILKVFNLDSPAKMRVALSEIDEVVKYRSGAGLSGGDQDDERVATVISMSSLEAKSEKEGDKTYKKLGQVLEYAIMRGDSDIAIIPNENGTADIKSRTARELRDVDVSPRLSRQETEVACRFLRKQTHANTDNTIPKAPEDGEMRFSCRYGTAFIRANFIPVKMRGVSPYVVAVSLRLQAEGGIGNDSRLRLHQLGLADTTQTLIKDALQLTEGLVVLAGPTNSGKSTTIAAMLDEHRDMKGDTVKRLSLEQPVERKIPGVIQFDVPKSMPFSKVLEGFMRHDPDMIFMGEIRDQGSAIAGVQAATTGHLVVTTTHSKTAVGAFTRMLNLMGADSDAYRQDLAEAVELIVAQRLTPLLCSHCRIERPVTEEEKAQFAREMRRAGIIGSVDEEMPERYRLPEVVYDRNLDGCTHCQSKAGRGVIRDMPINEVLVMTRNLRKKLIQGQVTDEDLEDARESTLLSEAVGKLRRGEMAFDVFIGFANQA